jgi:outer membrane protein OmpA-like peptidoglycan-associated protein
MLEDQSGLRLAAGALLGVLALGGCKFSASATGNVKSSGDAQGDANASMTTTEQPPAAEQPKEAIKFREGKLDYEGVINFEYDKADLRQDKETQGTLSEFKKFLEAHATVKIEIEGHTDSRGSDDYNRDLSDRRAASVRAWLLKNGVAEDRVTSVGKGEDSPQVPEPDECNDKLPADQAVCEAPWGKNRRVVFQVTGGAEALPAEKPPEPAPAPVTEAPAPAPTKSACPLLWGGHGNALGPNSWVTLAGAVQPRVCWLELSLGLGFGGNNADAKNNTASADGSYLSLTVPFRGRFWFMDTHSLIGDAGLGFTHYRISADLNDGAGRTGEYTRNTTAMIAHAGLGYGFRPNGSEAGWRLALTLGGLLHPTKLGSSSISAPATFTGGPGIKTAMDNETNELDDIEPYAEASFGWLFE